MKSIKSPERFQFWQALFCKSNSSKKVFVYSHRGFEVKNKPRLPKRKHFRDSKEKLICLIALFSFPRMWSKSIVFVSAYPAVLLFCSADGVKVTILDSTDGNTRLQVLAPTHLPSPCTCDLTFTKAKDSSQNMSETRGNVAEWPTLWT